MNHVWYHVKTGGLYKVLTYDAKYEHDLSRAVVYQAFKDNTVWIRPHSEFMDGRFIRLGDLATSYLKAQEELQELRLFQADAFDVHPNIDLDIEANK